MPTETENPSFDSGDALSEALRVYLEHRGSSSGASDSELLRRHPDLRELLQPLLEQDASSGGEIRPGAVIGDYRLVEAIGRGGMGEVWEAEQISLKRRVALKLLREHVFASSHSIERFKREALAGARLQHPCIVAVHAVGESNGIHFIAQELIESRRTLAALIRDAREEPAISPSWWRDTAQLFARLADALQLAHEHGIIHRDLKPSNVLIAKDGTPKIADFGLALVAGESELSRTGDLSGSPFYMSPEQAAAKRIQVDERSDVFSLGASLFEALTLQRPFEGDTVAQVLTKILFHDPRDPREIRSLCPRDLAVICMKMLEKAPTQRYPSMRAVADELERHLRNEPIQARPPGVIGRAAKWSRRHPVLASSSAIVCVSLVVLSALLVETLRARNAARSSAHAAELSAIAEAEAARKAQASADEARLEARTSSRIVDFLVAAFDEANPAKAQGRELTARDVLDRGVANIRSGLTDDAEVAARSRLLEALGMVYLRLGRLEEAENLLLEAQALAERKYGREDPNALDIARELAMLYAYWEKFERAVAVMTEVHAALVRREGAESAAALKIEGNLGAILWRSLDLDGAEKHLRHSLEGSKATGGWRGSSLYNLSEVLRTRGKEEESLALLQEALDLDMAYMGPDHPDTLNALEAVARHDLLAGRYEKASAGYRQVAIARTCVYGPKHQSALLAQAMAYNFGPAAERAQALQGLEQLRSVCLEEYGPDDQTTRKLSGFVASTMEKLGRYAESEPIRISVLTSLANLPGSSPVERCSALAGLGETEWHLGRVDLARSILDEAIALPISDAGIGLQALEYAVDRAIEIRESQGELEAALELAKSHLQRIGPTHRQRPRLEAAVRRLQEDIEDK